MHKSHIYIIICIFFAVVAAGCSVKKLIPEGRSVIVGSEVKVDAKKFEFSESDLSSCITYKTQSSFLGWMPRAWIYYKTLDKTDRGFYRWVHRNIGREPVLYNTQLVNKSGQLIEKYVNDVGYFKSTVTASTKFRKHYSYVTYNVHLEKPYKIQNLEYVIADTAIADKVKEMEKRLPVKPGEIFNAYTFDTERELITEHLLNNGYYFFSKNNIFYEIDSSLLQHKVNVKMHIVGNNHRKYAINNVNIYPDNASLSPNAKADTTEYESTTRRDEPIRHNFIYSGNPRIDFKTFDQVIQIRKGDIYSQRKVSNTYKALNGLKIYSSSMIDFDTIPSDNDSIGLLNCDITLLRSKAHFYNIQVEGTNSGGDLGMLGSVSYRNQNIFRGAEILSVSLRASIQAQKLMADILDSDIFNTKEMGLDISLTFPRFLSPFKLKQFVMAYQPKTIIRSGYNLQIRPLYSRYTLKAAFGYNWMGSRTIQHTLTPININSVKVDPTKKFEELLNQESSQRIKDQYTNHLIFGIDYSFIFNNQNIKTSRDYFYLKADIATSGNLISIFSNTSLVKKKDDYNEIFGIRYAQFVRLSLDFRYYHFIGRNKANQLAFRLITGIGLPYGSSRDMPFEESFYAGGANSMRGWQFRQLGPGEFSNPQGINMERIGDIHLEYNAEYRFSLSSIVKGAWFADVGNIWKLRPDDTFINGEFKFDKFFKELGVDVGLGFRFDFSFLLLRIDVATPLLDPEYAEGSRWRGGKLQFSNLMWNFGIGYPF